MNTNKADIYKIKEPTCISFSGGRTSAYMLRRVIDANNGLPNDAVVCFANTGKEMPQTLDFVRDCGTYWGVTIVWLERFARFAENDGRKKYEYVTKVVNYETASRNGEPFQSIIEARRYLPNPVARFCTAELKIRAISDYLFNVRGFAKPCLSMIGIRADEQRRAAKMADTIESGQERYLPLVADGVVAADVSKFWIKSEFDLQLPNNQGVTDWGNCDLCFLKGYRKKQSIIRERPELANWWIEMENKITKDVGKLAYFRADQPSYATMKQIAMDQSILQFKETETLPSCFCGD